MAKSFCEIQGENENNFIRRHNWQPVEDLFHALLSKVCRIAAKSETKIGSPEGGVNITLNIAQYVPFR